MDTAIAHVPLDGETGERMFDRADTEVALDALLEVTNGNEENAKAVIEAQIKQAEEEAKAIKKTEPKKPVKLSGSPMGMAKAKLEADEVYEGLMREYNGKLEEAERKAKAWKDIKKKQAERNADATAEEEAEDEAVDRDIALGKVNLSDEIDDK